MCIGDIKKMFIIYGLYDPTNNLLKYIGKTVSPLRVRLNGHIYKARSGRSKSVASLWILQLLNEEKRPIIRPIEIVYDETIDWKERETFWIYKFANYGIRLLNTIDGGNGSHYRVVFDESITGKMGKVSDEVIAKEVGLSRATITYHRNRLKIAAMPIKSRKFNPSTKGKPAHNRTKFSEDLISMMGTVPDHEIAQRAGVERRAVERYRKRNNIKSFSLIGENHHQAKLSKEDVKNIIQEVKYNTIKTVALKYNVSYHTIYDIVKGRSWKNG